MSHTTNVHYVDKYLTDPTNPIIVNQIGAGATGCRVFSALADLNEILQSLNHPGLFVRLFDDDAITDANMGKQKWSKSEIGLSKSVALVNRFNRFNGTNWKAFSLKFCKKNLARIGSSIHANITISCVDKAHYRFDIADILRAIGKEDKETRSKPMYWMDFGNDRHTGQVVISTINNIKQPASKKFNAVGKLPMVTDEFKSLLEKADDNDSPSCSVREAILKQSLFINLTLTAFGMQMLTDMFMEGLIFNRGLFLNLREGRTQPLPV